MASHQLSPLQIGDLTIRIPIIQGGMSVGISLSGLASAVANTGCVGVIGTAGIGMFEPDLNTDFEAAMERGLRKEIRLAKAMTNGVLGVNIMVALSNFDQLVSASIDEGIDIIFSGAGLPMRLPELLNKGDKTKLVPIVSSGRAARIISKRWIEKYNYIPDAIVVEGPLAGGHVGFKPEQINDPNYSLENLVRDVITAIKPFEEVTGRAIPIVAAGGIYTGEDIYKFMQLGAAGVQMATRFVATHECDASQEFKQAYIDCSKDEIVIVDSPVGLPGRAIKNEFIDSVNAGKKKPFNCPYHCIITCKCHESPYCIALCLANAKLGKLDKGYAFCGANAYKVNEIVSVSTLVHSLLMEYEYASMRATGSFRSAQAWQTSQSVSP